MIWQCLERDPAVSIIILLFLLIALAVSLTVIFLTKEY